MGWVGGQGGDKGKGGSPVTDDWKDRRDIENGLNMEKVKDDG